MQPYNPYYQQMMNYNPMFNAQQRLQQLEQQYPQYQQQNAVGTQMSVANQQQTGIQGKIVSDFETVKATETPLDGSITYFPLVNGEYIYTKFLNMNTGSSDYSVYRKVTEEQTESNDEFDIKSYLDEKFETLRQELKGGVKNGNTRKSSSKSNSTTDNE